MHGLGIEYDSSNRVRAVLRVKNDSHVVVPHIDDGPITLNSRDSVRTSGSIVGVQIKPNATVTTTHGVTGLEVSPRCTDIGSGELIAIKADPLLKAATAARTVSALRCIELNPSLPGSGSAYTITNDVTGIRMFLDMGAGHTVSGKKSCVLVATPNTSGWDYLFDLEASSGVVTAAAVGGSQSHKINIRNAGTNFFIPLHTA